MIQKKSIQDALKNPETIAVVEELLGNPLGYRSVVQNDFNDYTETGFHRILSGLGIDNNPGFNYGQLRVYNDGYYIIQEAVSSSTSEPIKRRKKEKESWSIWG